MSKYRTYINGHRAALDQRIPDTSTLHEAVTQIVGWANERLQTPAHLRRALPLQVGKFRDRCIGGKDRVHPLS